MKALFFVLQVLGLNLIWYGGVLSGRQVATGAGLVVVFATLGFELGASSYRRRPPGVAGVSISNVTCSGDVIAKASLR